MTVQRTARYYTMGTASPALKRVWFVLHGYGQLAKYFIRRFDVVADEETLIVAPEALSRLYTDAEYGKIGASWITREDRDNEVIDYLAYLNKLYDEVLVNHDPATLHITIMGFSQGAATACRWLNAGHIRADRLMLWAGFFPHGTADVIAPDKLANVAVQYVYGEKDEFIAQLPDPAAYLAQLKTDLPQLEIISFSGTHVVDREVLKRIA